MIINPINKPSYMNRGASKQRTSTLVAKRLSQLPTDEREQLESELEHFDQLGDQLTPKQSAPLVQYLSLSPRRV
jgi:protein tyrosine/serine phosphatase